VQGNLSAGQIVEQIFALNKLLAPQDQRISNVVFMGMGEPLANYAAVMKAIRIIHDPGSFNIGARKITISTVGVPPKMRQLAHEDLPLNLAISLHAPNERLRRELIPWAEHFPLNQILDAARYYFDHTGREITLEYILLSGVNDQPEHAFELIKVCRTLRANVNLIRYNEVQSLPFARPKSDDVMNFQAILRNNGINAHVRKSRGRDIDAACGQLRRSVAATPASPLVSVGAKGDARDRATDDVKRGFTLAELIVIIVILAILVSIFVPYLMNAREESRRLSCRDNLRQIFAGLQNYANDNTKFFPSVTKDAANPGAYVAFTGSDDPNPFAPNSAVKPNDVTASLWLLVRGGYLKETGVFVCPSAVGQKDLLQDPSGRGVKSTDRGNFRRRANLSYSYASPFSAAADYRLNFDNLKHDFVLMADRNPGATANVPFHAAAFEQKKINSRNHAGAGENVLYAAGYVAFQWTPYCAHDNDNIYTAQAKLPVSTTSSATPPSTNPATVPTTAPIAQSSPGDSSTSQGYLGKGLGPANSLDTYLVPTEQDGP
jgi:type II secretory pathway pseudopilin PulG